MSALAYLISPSKSVETELLKLCILFPFFRNLLHPIDGTTILLIVQSKMQVVILSIFFFSYNLVTGLHFKLLSWDSSPCSTCFSHIGLCLLFLEHIKVVRILASAFPSVKMVFCLVFPLVSSIPTRIVPLKDFLPDPLPPTLKNRALPADHPLFLYPTSFLWIALSTASDYISYVFVSQFFSHLPQIQHKFYKSRGVVLFTATSPITRNMPGAEDTLLNDFQTDEWMNAWTY